MQRRTSARPHNCARTLGPCAYVQVFPSGLRQAYQRVTTRLSDGFLESRLSKINAIGAPEYRETMYLSFTPDGLVARAERRRDDGTVTWAADARRLWVD